MFDGAQVLGVEDVGAVRVFFDDIEGPGAAFFFFDDPGVACGIDTGRLRFKVPATAVGATALIGIAVVEVAREQAAAGIRDAQGAVDEDFQLHVGAGLADLGDLVQ